MQIELALVVPAYWPAQRDRLILTVASAPDPEAPTAGHLSCRIDASLLSFSLCQRFGCTRRHFRHFSRGLVALAGGRARRTSLVDGMIDTRVVVSRADGPQRYDVKLVLANPARGVHEAVGEPPPIELPGFSWDRSRLFRAAFDARRFLMQVERSTGRNRRSAQAPR